MSSRAVAERATRSTGSFFHHWSSAEDYLKDLVAYIFRAGLLPENVEEIASAIEQLKQDPSDTIDGVRAICLSAFSHTVNDTFLPVELLLRSQPGDELIKTGLRTFYRDTDETSKAAYEALVSSWGLEPRSPFTYETVAVLFTALLEPGDPPSRQPRVRATGPLWRGRPRASPRAPARSGRRRGPQRSP